MGNLFASDFTMDWIPNPIKLVEAQTLAPLSPYFPDFNSSS